MWSLNPNLSEDEIRQRVWVQEPIREALGTAIKLRREIRMLSSNLIENIEKKTHLLKEANQTIELLRLGADLLIITTLYK